MERQLICQSGNVEKCARVQLPSEDGAKLPKSDLKIKPLFGRRESTQADTHSTVALSVKNLRPSDC